MNDRLKERRIIKTICVAILGLVFLQGCANAPIRSEFIKPNVELVPCAENKDKLWWEKPGFNWHTYKKIIFDPISIVGDAAADETLNNNEELSSLITYCHDTMVEKLGPEYQVVSNPGPDVLRIRVAIADIDTSSPILNAVTTVAIFVPLDMGGASIEVQFLESSTGELLAAMAQRKTGTPLQLMSSFSEFGHVKNAIDQWVEELKLAMVNNP